MTSSGACCRTSTLSRAAAGELIEVGYPSRSESARLSPTRPAAVPQDHLETVLIDSASVFRLPMSILELRSRTSGRPQAGWGCKLRAGASARVRDVQAQYVLGADGPRSVVRQWLGVGVQSTEEVLHSFSAVVRRPCGRSSAAAATGYT